MPRCAAIDKLAVCEMECRRIETKAAVECIHIVFKHEYENQDSSGEFHRIDQKKREKITTYHRVP
jgi:hypothetical protein